MGVHKPAQEPTRPLTRLVGCDGHIQGLIY